MAEQARSLTELRAVVQSALLLLEEEVADMRKYARHATTRSSLPSEFPCERVSGSTANE